MNSPNRRLRFSFACLLLAGLTTVISQGCDEMKRRALPAPLREPVERTLTGEIIGVRGGDNFEFRHDKETHYLLLRGIDASNLGKPLHQQSKRATINFTRKKTVTVHVFERDEVMREIVDVMVPVGTTKGDFDSEEFDLGLELIKRGLARYNGDSFSGAERLIEAEASAKKRKVGIWAEPKETPPEKSDDKK